eukprot:CAMPEP_0195129688 /NCGR_PEP_ID=MMETSP0448-20130528/141722_1 /TAXON_ID=66468 /ORGANISM="Heterocapsa triquestra, Strain CCMP 448" /LENGTH=48 /DNA_ID= /DNA_START= /DNA_END= /DNA_ORIENTATION=
MKVWTSQGDGLKSSETDSFVTLSCDFSLVAVRRAAHAMSTPSSAEQGA